MNDLTITTVIPTLRRPHLLPHAIRSVLRQTWTGLQVCVYDNASGDETRAIVEALAVSDSRVRYHCHPRSISAYENVAFGVRMVRTPLFSILADDDVLLPTFYQRAIEAFRRYPEAMFVGMPTLDVDDAGFALNPVSIDEGSPVFYRAGEAFGNVPGIWTGYVLRRQIVDEIGFIREQAGPAADVGFIRHVAARYAGVVIPGIAALMRAHPANASTVMNPLVKANRSFWSELAEGIETDPLVPGAIRRTVRRDIERMYVAGLRRNALGSLAEGKRESALESTSALARLGYGSTASLLRFLVACNGRCPPMARALSSVIGRRRAARARQLRVYNESLGPAREMFLSLLNGRQP